MKSELEGSLVLFRSASQEVPACAVDSAFYHERIRDEVVVFPWLLPVTVPVGSPFLDVSIGNREEIESVIDECFVLLLPNLQEVPTRAVENADVPIRQAYFELCFGLHIE